MRIPFVDLGAQYRTIQDEVQRAVMSVLESGDYILGEAVQLFEEEFARYVGADHAVGVDSGLSALELGLRALGVGPGDEVIAPANTFIASASAICATGAKPVLVDVDPETYNMDVAAIEAAITPRTKAIMPVHLYGRPADMDAILAIARKRDLAVIEDAAQAHGASYKGRRVGSLGDVGAFSFYPAKNLGAYGDGGMLVTSDSAIAEQVGMLRNYGQKEKYRHVLPGYNRRLDTVQAAVLRVKLRRLDDWNEARQRHARQYSDLLQGSAVALPQEARSTTHVYHLYVIRTENRDALSAHLSSRGVSTGIHYPYPIHLHESMRGLGYENGEFPIAERYSREILSLPMFPELTADQIETVACAVKAFGLVAQGKTLSHLCV